jgi:hypothetical protein
MTTLADILSYKGTLPKDQQNAWRESQAQGLNDSDIYNWFQAKQANPDAVAAGQAAFNADPANQYGPGKLSLIAQYVDPNFRGIAMSAGDNSDEGNQQATYALKQAQTIDPNAHFDQQGILQFDRSKLPSFSGGNQNAQYINKGLSNLNIDSGQNRVQDLSKVIHDPNYGNYTAASNLSTSPGDSTSGFMGQLGKYAPAAISAIMAAGMGAAAGPLIGGLMSGTLGPNGIADKLTTDQPINWGQTGMNMGIGALGGVLGGAGGLVPSGVSDAFKAISPYVNIGRGIYGATKGNIGSGVGAGMTLAQLLNSGGG